jgi:hypothetical protein
MFSVRHNRRKYLDFVGVRLQVCMVPFPLRLLHSFLYANCFVRQDKQGCVWPWLYVRKTVKPLIGTSDVIESRWIRYLHWNTSCTIIGKFTCKSGYIRNKTSRQNIWNKIYYGYVILLIQGTMQTEKLFGGSRSYISAMDCVLQYAVC